MVEEWRILGLEINDAFSNMAIDEAICRLRSEDKSQNTIRFYRWKPSAVSIGYFQLLEQEVNLDACKMLGVDIIRRMTGGGAVFHSYEGELTYSIIVNQYHPRIPNDILKSYEVICSGIVQALDKLGINAEFKPVNDIEVNSKKISGNAQTRRWGVVLQHGTILLSTDIDTMFKVLNVSKEKISDKMIKAVESRVTTIQQELKRDVSFIEVSDALRDSFSTIFNVTLVKGKLSKEENKLAMKLREEKYCKEDWIFKRPHTSNFKSE